VARGSTPAGSVGRGSLPAYRVSQPPAQGHMWPPRAGHRAVGTAYVDGDGPRPLETAYGTRPAGPRIGGFLGLPHSRWLLLPPPPGAVTAHGMGGWPASTPHPSASAYVLWPPSAGYSDPSDPRPRFPAQLPGVAAGSSPPGGIAGRVAPDDPPSAHPRPRPAPSTPSRWCGLAPLTAPRQLAAPIPS
jgi:hypothetical protein